jgi:hypothetical protein
MKHRLALTDENDSITSTRPGKTGLCQYLSHGSMFRFSDLCVSTIKTMPAMQITGPSDINAGARTWRH